MGLLRWIGVRVGSVVALIALGCVVVFGLASGGSSGATPTPRTSRFVATFDLGGVKHSMAIYSALTGRRVRQLGTFGSRLTGEGLAVTANDTAVFYVVQPRNSRQQSLDLMRLDAATGRRQLIAEGQQPAVDAMSSQLAFITGLASVEVRDLRSGDRREVDLERMLGHRFDPLNSQLAWLGDHRTLVMLPADRAVLVSSTHNTADKSDAPCHSTQTSWRLVFIHVPRTGPMTARCRSITATAALPAPLPDEATVLAASPSDPTAVWIADSGEDVNTIQQIAPTGPPRLVAELDRNLLPQAIDSTSRQLLYVDGHPPVLWEANLTNRHLTRRRPLITRSNLDEVAW